jgi:SAM-dependent methyltransferase
VENEVKDRSDDFAKRSKVVEGPIDIPPPPQETFHYDGFAIPISLMLLTGGGPDSFDLISREHIEFIKKSVELKPYYSVLEIGCGIGRDAIPLTKLLSKSGKYLGVDIDRPTIEWCAQNISAKFPNFRFEYLDVKNDLYNPRGTLVMSDVRISLEIETVDLIIAQSVFTHSLRPDIVHYMKEFSRLLKPGGLALTTFFIINDAILASARDLNLTQWNLKFGHEIDAGCRINNPLQPNEAVAYTAEALDLMMNEAGLRLAKPLVMGRWSGYFDEAPCGQDVAILTPSTPWTLHEAIEPVATAEGGLVARPKGLAPLLSHYWFWTKHHYREGGFKAVAKRARRRLDLIFHAGKANERSGAPPVGDVNKGDICLENSGYCSICMKEARFVARNEWLRDHYLCERCRSIPRQRALVEVLNFFRPDWRSLAIHESSPSMRFFAEQARNYSCSFFYEGVPIGAYSKDGILCQNLENLTFSDSTFDIFITQDVLEHVFQPDVALREIMRVLRPGGIHIFTAPKHKHLLKSYPRAKMVAGSIEHLLEPNYHGNPIGDGRSLVTWDYGSDFDDLIGQWSGYCTSNFIIRNRAHGMDGEYLDVFVTCKEPVNRIAAT